MALFIGCLIIVFSTNSFDNPDVWTSEHISQSILIGVGAAMVYFSGVKQGEKKPKR